MQQPKNLNRLLRALSRQGLDVSYSNKVYSISLNSSLHEHWQDATATRELNSFLHEHWQDASATRELNSFLHEHWQDASATRELNSFLHEHWQDASATTAEVLLPEDFPVEAKALKQLASLANVRHPQGGCVCRACATPDFHPGNSGVAKWLRKLSIELRLILGEFDRDKSL